MIYYSTNINHKQILVDIGLIKNHRHCYLLTLAMFPIDIPIAQTNITHKTRQGFQIIRVVDSLRGPIPDVDICNMLNINYFPYVTISDLYCKSGGLGVWS